MDQIKTTQALKQIFDQCGTNILWDRRRFESVLMDMLPGSSSSTERLVLRHALDSSALTLLLRAPAFTADAARRAVEQLHQESRMGAEDAEFVVRCVIAARGGDPNVLNVTVPEPPKPIPEPPKPAPEPTAGVDQGDFRNTSSPLWLYVLIYLAAAAGLAVLAQIITWTYQNAIWAVPGMLSSAVFYVVSAVFVLRCRLHIRELSDIGSADSVRRTTAFFGTLILIHVLVTALHQFILWFDPDLFEYGPGFMIYPGTSAAFCVVGAVFVFLFRRHIREMMDAGLTDSVRHTAALFGTLILIRVLLGAVPRVIIWIDPDLLTLFFDW